MAGVVKETGTDCPSRTSEFIPGFWWGLCSSSFEFSALCFFPLRPMYCTVSFTGSSIRDCPFVLCIVLSVSLDRPFGITPSSCALHCQFHWIVHSGLPLRPVYCTVSFTGSSIRDCPFVLCIVLSVSLDCPFGIAPSSCVLHCQFHRIVHSGLPLCIVLSFTGLSIPDCPFVLCIVLSVLHGIVHSGAPSSCCTLHWIVHSGIVYCTSFTGSIHSGLILCIVPVSLDRPFGIAPSSCVLYCQFHWIVHSGLPLRPVYCTVKLHRTKGESSSCTVQYTGRPFGIAPSSCVLYTSLVVHSGISSCDDCPFGIAPSSCVLYCQFHWIVHSGSSSYCTVSFTGSIRAPSSCEIDSVNSQDDWAFRIAPSSSEIDSTVSQDEGALPLRPVYCTVNFTGLSIPDCPFVLCTVLYNSLDVHSGIAPSILCIDSTIHRSKGQSRMDDPVMTVHSSIRDCPFVLCIVLSVSLDPVSDSYTGLPLRPVYCTVNHWIEGPFGIAPSSCVLYSTVSLDRFGIPLRSCVLYSTVSLDRFGIARMDDPVKLFCTIHRTKGSRMPLRSCEIVLSVSQDRPFGHCPFVLCIDSTRHSGQFRPGIVTIRDCPVKLTVQYTGRRGNEWTIL